jgi:hypothetical protein
MDITFEDEGAATTETETLTGTTPVATTATFTNIDAIWLDAEPVGDITISDGTTTLCVIYGSATYAQLANDGSEGTGLEGDQGVPLLGSGSHDTTPIATAYEQFIDDTITRGGSALATYINSAEMRVSNNLEMFPQLGEMGKIIVPGLRNVELSASVFGPSESHTQIMDHLRVVESNIVWTLNGGTLTLTGAVLRDPPSRSYTAEEVTMSLDCVFVGQGVAASTGV